MARGVTNVAPAELRAQLEALVRYRREHLTGDEKGEAQVPASASGAFGHEGLPEAGAHVGDASHEERRHGHRFR